MSGSSMELFAPPDQDLALVRASHVVTIPLTGWSCLWRSWRAWLQLVYAAREAVLEGD